MVDFTLTDPQRALQRAARDFARNEIRPIAAEVDSNPDPKTNLPRELYRKANALGFNKALVPEAFGGPGLGVLDVAITIEELAWGDAGVAVSYVGHWLCVRPIIDGGSASQQQQWLSALVADDDGMFLGAIAATEHGVAAYLTPREYRSTRETAATPFDPSNFVTNYTLPLGERREVTTKALADGDDYVINGVKCFITNGPVASVYLVTGTTDPTKPDAQTTAALLVSRDTPGVSIGTIEDKMGQRLSTQSEVVFEDARVPRENMLPPEDMGVAMGRALECSTTLVGALCVGLARAAYEEALDYAKVRYKGGNRIIFHQAIGMKLADMAIAIKTARLLAYQAAWDADNGAEPSALQPMAKVYCSDVAMKVTLDAMQLFGGYGYMRDLPLEKWVRDARVTQIYDLTNEMLRVNSILPVLAAATTV